MTEIWLQLFAGLACLLGSLLFVASGIGLLRLPDLYSRAHAPTKAATLGLVLFALGSALGQRDGSTILEDLLIVAFVMLTLPASAAALVDAARRREDDNE